jgi:hypothetical protein
MFLRLDNKWAIHKHPHSAQPPLASMAFITQLLMMYIWTALLKWHPIWHTDGTAVYYALNLDGFTTPLGHWLSMRPQWLLKTLTFATFGLELLGPWIWLLAFRSWKIRTGVIMAFIAFHLGLILTLELGPFPYACIIFWLGLTPGDFWQELSSRFPAYRDYFRPIVILEDRLELNSLKTVLMNSFLIASWGLVMIWNIAGFSDNDSINLAPGAYRAGTILRLHQKWEMFAPYPKTSDSWLVVDTKLLNDEHWDVLNDRPVSFEKPKYLSEDMIDTLWRKYLNNLSSVTFKDHLPYFSRWMCREWNKQNRETKNKAIHLEIWMLGENTPPPGQAPQPLEKLKIWDHYCLE